jgi:predicted dithiol-disulfide oxidoreductase (DUF899 family)
VGRSNGFDSGLPAELDRPIVAEEHGKELTQQRDRINAERRRLPMIKLEKEYTFESLLD